MTKRDLAGCATDCVCGHGAEAHHVDEWNGGHFCREDGCECFLLRCDCGLYMPLAGRLVVDFDREEPSKATAPVGGLRAGDVLTFDGLFDGEATKAVVRYVDDGGVLLSWFGVTTGDGAETEWIDRAQWSGRKPVRRRGVTP